MNFFAYLESRFVQSQIEIQQMQATATGGLAINHAAKAQMWLWLKLATIFHFFMIPFQYLGVLVHALDAPAPAREMARKANEEQAAKLELEAKIARVNPSDKSPRAVN